MAQYPLFTPVQYKGESTYGTSASPDTAIGSIQNISTTNANSFTYVKGQNRTVQKAVLGRYTTGITGSYQLHDFAFLRHFIGPLTGDGNAQGTAYTLTSADYSSVSSSAGVQAFTMEIGNSSADTKIVYTGCMGNDFSISGNVGQVLTCSFNIMAQKPTDSATATAYSEPTTLPWVFHQGTLKFGSTPSTVAEVQSFNIFYNNKLIQNYGAGAGRFMKIPLLSDLDINFSFTLRASSTDYQTIKDEFYGASNTPEDGSVSVLGDSTNDLKLELSEGSGVGLRNADIFLESAYLDNMDENVAVGGDNIVEFTVSGTASDGYSGAFIKWWTGTRS